MRESNRIRVVHLVSTLNIGGLEKVVCDLVREVERENIHAEVVCLGEIGALADEFKSLDVTVTALNVLGNGILAPANALLRYLQSTSFDVLHTHNETPHLAGALVRCRLRVPVLVHTKHGRNQPDKWKRVAMNRFSAWMSDVVVAVSHDAADVCRGIERIPERKIRVIHNGIDLQRFVPHQEVTSERVLRAIHVARIADPPKDHATLLRAVRLVVDQIPSFQLEIVGDGPSRPEIEFLCGQLDLRENVTFSGFRSDVAKRLSKSGLAILSSLTEGLSITLLEAMAMGLPVVATNVGGNKEVVVHDETGLLVPPRQPSLMASAILEFIRSPAGAAEMGRSGRRRVETRFGLPNVARQYEELYASLLRRTSVGKSKAPALSHA